MLFLLLLKVASADGYLLGEAGVGATTHYQPGNTQFFSGINGNLGLAAGVIFPRQNLSAMFLHSRTDIDIGTTHSFEEIHRDLGVEVRNDSHAGVQFKRFIPLNLAMKDLVFRYDSRGFYSRGLYGAGIMIPKEYFRKGDGNIANVSLSFGARVHSELSKTPFAVQPELYIMHGQYSIRLNALQTFGSGESTESLISGMFLYRLIPQMQIGFRWYHSDIYDVSSGLDSTQQEWIFFVTI